MTDLLKRNEIDLYKLQEINEDKVAYLIKKLKNEKSRYNQEIIARRIGEFRSEPTAVLVAELLDSENTYSRNTAIQILQNVGEVSIPVLENKFALGDRDVRKFVLDVLKEIKTEASSLLAQRALNDKDETVMQAAVEVMGAHKFLPALPILLDILKQTNSVWIIDSLINTLGQIGEASAKESIVKKLEEVSLGKIEKNIILNSYVKALASLGDFTDLAKIFADSEFSNGIMGDNLLECINGIVLRHYSEPTSSALISQIEKVYKSKLKFDDPDRILALLQSAVKLQLNFFVAKIPKLIKRFNNAEFFAEALFELTCKIEKIAPAVLKSLLQAQDINVLVFALKVIKQKRINGYDSEISKLVWHQDISVSMEALKIIIEVENYYDQALLNKIAFEGRSDLAKTALDGILRQGSSDSSLILKSIKHPDDEIRKLALEYLTKSTIQFDINQMIAIATEFKDATRLEALELLVRLQDSNADRIIKEIIDSDNAKMRRKLPEILDSIKDRDSFYSYINILLNDPDTGVRRKVIKTLIKRIEPQAFELLMHLAQNENSLENKYEIVSSLHKYPYEAAFTLMVEALNSGQILLKLAAINSLGLYADKKAITLLDPYRYSDVLEIQESVQEAMERLGVLK